MKRADALKIGAAFALALAMAGCDQQSEPEQQAPVRAQPQAQGTPAGTQAGVTPMAERVAIIGVLNKRNGIVRNLRMRPGQAARFKDAIVRLRACETTAPWEREKLTGAFLQLDVQRPNDSWQRVFSGWVYKETPSLNVVEHPVYDVWPRSCAMTFPGGTPIPEEETSNSSSAENSPGPRRSVPASPPSAADNSDT